MNIEAHYAETIDTLYGRNLALIVENQQLHDARIAWCRAAFHLAELLEDKEHVIAMQRETIEDLQAVLLDSARKARV